MTKSKKKLGITALILLASLMLLCSGITFRPASALRAGYEGGSPVSEDFERPIAVPYADLVTYGKVEWTLYYNYEVLSELNPVITISLNGTSDEIRIMNETELSGDDLFGYAQHIIEVEFAHPEKLIRYTGTVTLEFAIEGVLYRYVEEFGGDTFYSHMYGVNFEGLQVATEEEKAQLAELYENYDTEQTVINYADIDDELPGEPGEPSEGSEENPGTVEGEGVVSENALEKVSGFFDRIGLWVCVVIMALFSVITLCIIILLGRRRG